VTCQADGEEQGQILGSAEAGPIRHSTKWPSVR